MPKLSGKNFLIFLYFFITQNKNNNKYANESKALWTILSLICWREGPLVSIWMLASLGSGDYTASGMKEHLSL